MKIELDVKFNIGDKVLVKKPHSGAYSTPEPFIAKVGGYVVNISASKTRIYYTLEKCEGESYQYSAIIDYNRKKRYNAKDLELIEK